VPSTGTAPVVPNAGDQRLTEKQNQLTLFPASRLCKNTK